MTEETGPPEQADLGDQIAQVQMLTEGGMHGEARTLCQELVRLHPDSGPAHAAMGDVHAAEGTWNEAVDWYELALNLSFDSTVMEKLAAARSRAIRAGGPSPSPGILPPEPLAAEEPRSSQQVVGLVIAGVLLVSMLAFFFVRSATQRDEGDRAADAHVGPAQPPPGPEQPPGAGYASPPRSQPTAGATSGATLESASPSLASQPTARYSGQSSSARPGSGQSQPSRSTVLASSHDQQVLNTMHHLRRNPGSSSRSAVASLALDDYSGLGILSIRASLTSNLAQLEQNLMLKACQSAISAMRADPKLNSLIVRGIAEVPNDKGKAEDVVIFRATATREALKDWIERNQAPAAHQVSGLLTDVWWDQQALARYLRSRGRGR